MKTLQDSTKNIEGALIDFLISNDQAENYYEECVAALCRPSGN